MKQQRSYYVYIMTNQSRNLYIGVTNNLESRVFDHKENKIEGFTKRYNINQLVYFGEYNDVTLAIEREKQLKGWTRKKKIYLIEQTNPNWDDLSEAWYAKVSLSLERPDPSATPAIQSIAGSAQDDSGDV
ncbi:MAG: GIY-YIG nuclease family protein [Patescibacteria group bacterium]|nr:GIY-YIG nuclease family protein [Patescibacteria group bacterium]MBU2509356.1 GIY-YIG nuclease family protein [Patescibacteria group bacterium]